MGPPQRPAGTPADLGECRRERLKLHTKQHSGQLTLQPIRLVRQLATLLPSEPSSSPVDPTLIAAVSHAAPTPRISSEQPRNTSHRASHVTATHERPLAREQRCADLPGIHDEFGGTNKSATSPAWEKKLRLFLISLPLEIRKTILDAYNDIDVRRLDDAGKLRALKGVTLAAKACQEARMAEKQGDWAASIGAVGEEGFTGRVKAFVESHRAEFTRRAPRFPPAGKSTVLYQQTGHPLSLAAALRYECSTAVGGIWYFRSPLCSVSWQAGTFSSTLPFVRESDIILSTALHQFEGAGLRHLLSWQKQIRDAGGEMTIAGQGELDRGSTVHDKLKVIVRKTGILTIIITTGNMGAHGEGVEAQFCTDYAAAAAAPKSDETLVKIEFDLHDPATQGYQFLDALMRKDVNLRAKGLIVLMVPTLNKILTTPPPIDETFDRIRFENQQRKKLKLSLLPIEEDPRVKVVTQQYQLDKQLVAMVSRASTSPAIEAASRAPVDVVLEKRLILTIEEIEAVRRANEAHNRLVNSLFPPQKDSRDVATEKEHILALLNVEQDMEAALAADEVVESGGANKMVGELLKLDLDANPPTDSYLAHHPAIPGFQAGKSSSTTASPADAAGSLYDDLLARRSAGLKRASEADGTATTTQGGLRARYPQASYDRGAAKRVKLTEDRQNALYQPVIVTQIDYNTASPAATVPLPSDDSTVNAPSTEYRRCALRFLGDISLVKVSSEWVDSVLYVRMELSAKTGDPVSPASDDDSASLAADNKDSTVISILADPSLPFPFVTMPEIKRLFQAFIRRAYEMGESQVLVELLNEKQFRGVEFDSTSALGTAISSLPEPSPLRGVKKAFGATIRVLDWHLLARALTKLVGICALKTDDREYFHFASSPYRKKRKTKKTVAATGSATGDAKEGAGAAQDSDKAGDSDGSAAGLDE
uniref:BY PROTMAP: gi/342321526/gb/EGU13459.1/ Proteophosphoglycan ppg4 [Rhodotorula glutinis ATCC 204091] n=1 Tax=Rhodotorula toruloides TaxID=5286 RepID=A0A0K3CN44_RHOTO